MIVEGAMAKWMLSEVQKGTPWDNIVVHHPDAEQSDTIPVLIVPVGSQSVAAAREKIEHALHRSGS